MKKIDYHRELNPAQLKAVESIHGPHLVIAGAGSGKTRVLVHRVAYLVQQGIAPEQILLLTFTRRSAQEMLQRASLLLDERCRKVSGGTFHSFANLILRKYAKLLEISNNFTILDQADAEDAVNLIRTRLNFHKSEKRFPRKHTILEVISKSVNKSEELAGVLLDEYPQFIEFAEEIKKIRDAYNKYKRQKSLLDYDDLLIFLKNLLTKHAAVRASLGAKYKYIMVDEYQDTNKLQAHIACLLAAEHTNIMVVGDDAQSIYSFRGANFKNIIDFPKIFKGTKIITLQENYRSTQPILNLTNAVIAQAKEKFQKNLYTRKKGGETPVFIDCPDENLQSVFVAEKIMELREEGVALKDMAVLFRSGWHSNDLEIELASRNIPFAKYGGQKFVEAAHIKDLVSYLRIAYNGLDQVSWLRVLELIPRIGPKTAIKIIEAIPDQARLEQLWQKNDLKLKKLFELLKNINLQTDTPAEIIARFLSYYQPLLKMKYDDFNQRLNDLDSLLRIAQRYKTTEQFLVDLALEPPERMLVEPARPDKDDAPLTLSTIHSAKGLEWHTVFLIYVAEGHLPSYLSLETEEQIEEERRLFYVAATRAKANLFLLKPHIDRSPRSFSADGGGAVFTQTSRFLEQGGLLGKFVDIQSAGVPDEPEDLELEDIIGEKRNKPKVFFETLEEYFRNE